MKDRTSGKPLKYAVIIVLCCVSFADKLEGEFVFDDNAAILNNKLVTSPANSWLELFERDYWGTRILSETSHKSYRPLASLTFRLEYQWRGKEASPFWMKLTNFLIHVCISCLVLEFGDLFVRDKCRTSFLAAAVFSVHPVHTEAVAGIVGRADLLATLGFILVVMVYFKAFIAKAVCDRKLFYVGQVFHWTLISVLCKETALSLLFVCAGLDVLHNTNLLFVGTSKLQDWKKLPLFRLLMLLLFSGLIIGVRLYMGLPQFHIEDNPVAVIDDKLFRAINQIFLHALNAWLLLCPDWLCFDWALGCVTLIKSWTDVRLLGILIYVTIFASLCLRASRAQLSAIILIVIPFLPASGIIHVGFVIAERILYMSSIGWCLLIASGYRKLIQFSSNHISRVFLKVTFILFLLVCVLKTRIRATEWSNERQLYTSGLRVCPNNAKVHYNIGNIAAKKNEPQMAIQFYRQAIDLYPNYEAALMNLGNLYRDRGDLTSAEHFLQRALDSINVTDKRAAAEMNMGIVRGMKKRYEDALQHYFRALEARPYYPVCYYNMGNAYLEMRQMDMAQKHFEMAIIQDGTLEVAWKNLLTLLYNEGKFDEVLVTADKASEVLPAAVELQFPKANVLAKLKRYEEAERTFLAIIEQRPKEAIFHANLGVLYHHWRRLDSAAVYYEKALGLDPSLDRIRAALNKVKPKAI